MLSKKSIRSDPGSLPEQWGSGQCSGVRPQDVKLTPSKLHCYIGVLQMAGEINLQTALDRLRRAVPEDLWPPDAAGLEDLQRNVSQLPLEVSQVYGQIGGTRWSPRLPF